MNKAVRRGPQGAIFGAKTCWLFGNGLFQILYLRLGTSQVERMSSGNCMGKRLDAIMHTTYKTYIEQELQ